MEFSEVLRRRRMVRHYTDRPLAPEVVEHVLDAALRAPSAGFSQGWAFLVLTEPADRARFWPYVPTRATQTPTGMAALCMLLTAVDEGLGACLFGIQDDQRAGFRAEFGIPDEYEPVGGITVGHRHPDLAPQDTATVAERAACQGGRRPPGRLAAGVTRCVVLLRGVNVGRAHRIAMPDLRATLEQVGCRDVTTYVQSGNAVVDWSGTGAELESAAAAGLAARGLAVPVMVRTAAELARVVAGSPWTGLDPTLFHVAFLAADPDPAAVAAIDHEALLPERVVVGERVLYLDYAGGVHRSRGLARLRLGVDATARNWRTVTALHELAG